MNNQKKLKIKFIRNMEIKKILFKILYCILSICILYNIVYLINTTITKKDYLEIFGISLFVIDSDLMENDLYKNDLVITKNVNEKDLKTDDIISYQINDRVRINKIINIYNDEKTGEKIYVTKFNKNYYPDIEKLSVNKIIGRKIVSIRFLGIFIKFFQSKVTTFFVFIMLLLAFYYNNQLYRKNRERKRKRKIDNKLKNDL